MQFNTSSKAEQRSKRRCKITATSEETFYKHSLQFYRMPPTETISLQELEELAMNRLKVLRVVETVGIRHPRGGNDHRDALMMELKKLAKEGIMRGLIRSHVNNEDPISAEIEAEERRKDHLSHFILRLAYCKTEDLRRWFIAQESDLFRFRFSLQSPTSTQEFLALNDLHYTPISKEEKDNKAQLLLHARPNFTEAEMDLTEFYKVYFTEALELVRGCRVYLERGYAYVPQTDLVVIILSVFRSRLSHDLTIAARCLPHIGEEERLIPLLSDISRQCAGGQEYKACSTGVTADMIDSLSKSSFPLCMQHLHFGLRQNHHLKYGGRNQYGLFLKGIGLSLEEALRFWRMELTRIMDGDKFEKQYAYSIRHSFGKEGKRTDYTPYNCMKIITSNPPATGDYHGCPYRHMDADLLKQRLQALHLPSSGTEEVLELTKQGHYQLACGRCFEVKNGVDTKFVPQHPNQYYDAGVKLNESKTTNGVSTPGSTNNNASVGGKVVIVKSQKITVSAPSSSDNQSRLDAFDDDLPLDAMDEFHTNMDIS